MLIIQRNAVVAENQKMTTTPAAVLRQSEHSGSLECAQGRLLKLFEHLSKLVFCARRVAGWARLSNAPLTNET